MHLPAHDNEKNTGVRKHKREEGMHLWMQMSEGKRMPGLLLFQKTCMRVTCRVLDSYPPGKIINGDLD